jgi:hypothetical protein
MWPSNRFGNGSWPRNRFGNGTWPSKVFLASPSAGNVTDSSKELGRVGAVFKHENRERPDRSFFGDLTPLNEAIPPKSAALAFMTGRQTDFSDRN